MNAAQRVERDSSLVDSESRLHFVEEEEEHETSAGVQSPAVKAENNAALLTVPEDKSKSSTQAAANRLEADYHQKLKNAQKQHSEVEQSLLQQPAPDLGFGWVKAMFDSMDDDNDGRVTINELRTFAATMKMPKVYMEDFLHYVARDVRHENATVSFTDFVTTIRAKEMALNKACQPFETDAKASVWDESIQRGQWLLGLMVIQSVSGFILQSYEALIKNHLVVTLFLTMLIGAGGNAGNQSTIKVIEGMASGEIRITWSTFWAVLEDQFAVGLVLACFMTVAGFCRVLLTNGLTSIPGDGMGWELTADGLKNCVAISMSLFAIVLTSCVVGTVLPFSMAAINVDAANAGPTIQVTMDIIGVMVTCGVCKLILQDNALKKMESCTQITQMIAKSPSTADRLSLPDSGDVETMLEMDEHAAMQRGQPWTRGDDYNKDDNY